MDWLLRSIPRCIAIETMTPHKEVPAPGGSSLSLHRDLRRLQVLAEDEDDMDYAAGEEESNPDDPEGPAGSIDPRRLGAPATAQGQDQPGRGHRQADRLGRAVAGGDVPPEPRRDARDRVEAGDPDDEADQGRPEA